MVGYIEYLTEGVLLCNQCTISLGLGFVHNFHFRTCFFPSFFLPLEYIGDIIGVLFMMGVVIWIVCFWSCTVCSEYGNEHEPGAE